jgi:amiloride-sensitive sodium channel
MFHNPTSVPSISDYGFVVSSGNEYFLPVMPSVIHADPAIYHIDPLVRQCFLSNERKLTFFTHYTEENCFTECATNHTYKFCGCVPHFLPHSSSQMVCGPSQVKCAKNVLNGLRENFEVGVVYGCNCMKGCTELEYDKEISHSPIAKLRWQDNATQVSPLPSESDAAIMHVFFKKENFFKHKRSELFGAIDFFSNVGGLLSLCIGFSALSIVEVIYFFYLRLFCPCGKGAQTVDKC